MVSRLQKFSVGFLGLISIFLMFGCGGGAGGGTLTQLRVLDASPDEPNVQVVVDGAALGNPLSYQSNTGYQTVHSGARQFAIEEVGTTINLLPNYTTLNLESGTQTTIILAGFSANLQGITLADDNTAPSSGTANIRVVNAAPSLGSVDVYVVPQGTSLNNVTPTFNAQDFGQASTYTNVSVGSSANFQIYFTAVGTKFTYLSTGPISFLTGQNRTIVGLNGTSGGAYTFVTLKDLN